MNNTKSYNDLVEEAESFRMPWVDKYNTRLVPGTEHYFAAQEGVIISTQKWNDGLEYRILNGTKDWFGYWCVNIDGKRRKLHEVILTTWRGARPIGTECRHLNGDKDDNRLINLVWGTRSQNTKDQIGHGTWNGGFIGGEKHPMSKLAAEDVSEIFKLHHTGQYKHSDIAKMFGVNQSTVTRILSGKRWKKFIATKADTVMGWRDKNDIHVEE